MSSDDVQKDELSGVLSRLDPKDRRIIEDRLESMQRVETQLQELKLYMALYESTPVAIFVLSQHGIIKAVNAAACKLLGYEEKTLLKRDIQTFLSSREEERSMGEQLFSELGRGASIEAIEISLETADGEDMWVSISTNSMPDGSVIAMALDIDRRRAAETKEKIERGRADLYLDVITHDLANVNQTITFSLGLLEEALDIPETLQDLVDESKWSISRATRMVTNLRTIWEIRANPPLKMSVAPHQYLASAITSVQDDFPNKQIDVNCEFQHEQPTVAAHRYLENVMFTILHNSVMFSAEDVVTIDVRISNETPGFLRMEFMDRGQGIPDKIKTEIFRRTGDRNGQTIGRGFGLTLADIIVDELGGRIWVEDRVQDDPSQGANFILEVPLWREKFIPECGRVSCITFVKANKCLFCGPMLEILNDTMNALQMDTSIVHVVNIDDPRSGVSREDYGTLPHIHVCDGDIIGFVPEDEVRQTLMNSLSKHCAPIWEFQKTV